jgi:F-type H+-transporting ATPase subunit a
MQISPDQTVYWQWGAFTLNATIVFTWVVMAILVITAALVTRRLRTGARVSRWQLFVEIVVIQIRRQIRDAAQEDPDLYLPFIGTLFLFIAFSSLLSIVPGVSAPTASLNTAAALAVTVFFAVPVYGIARSGAGAYLRHFVQPTPFMLPFHLISELSRTLALAVRLFGNIMSGSLIVAILITVAPFLFPALLEAFGLLIGFIQAYVFAVLSLVYIASATRSHRAEEEKAQRQTSEKRTRSQRDVGGGQRAGAGRSDRGKATAERRRRLERNADADGDRPARNDSDTERSRVGADGIRDRSGERQEREREGGQDGVE